VKYILFQSETTQTLLYRAPDGTGWEDKIVPWDFKEKIPIPSRGIFNIAAKFN
jgi:hypothetical protein